MEKELEIVGRRVNRADALSKALGTVKYVSDTKRKDMLVGKALFAGFPHALIKKVDVSKAAALPGVVAVMTAKDLPGRNAYGFIIPDKPVIALDKTRFQGDPVALVAAATDEAATMALELIEVEYEPLPVYGDTDAAMKEDSVPLHESHPSLEKGNRMKDVVINRGDTEKAFNDADIVIENVYETPMAEHCYFEPDCCIAEPDPFSGGLTLHCPTQGATAIQRVLAPVFGLPHSKLRVVCPVVGGGFGGREDSSLEVGAMAGVLALKTGKTVAFEYSREEIFRTTGKRNAALIRHRLAATKDGKITAIEVESILKKGAYASLAGGRNPSNAIIMRNAIHSGGVYVIPNVKVSAYGVFTNTPPGCPFRGFGVPQANFGIECQMDELARRVGTDPVEIRRKNLFRAGDRSIFGQEMTDAGGLGLEECIDKVTEKFGWDKPFDHGDGHIKRGRGFATLMYGTGAPNPTESASCYMQLNMDGTLSLNVGTTEMGQGLNSAFAQMAAETLGIRYEDVHVSCSDSLFPDSGPTVASRGTTVVGNAVVDGCMQIKRRLAGVAAEMLEAAPSGVEFKNNAAYLIRDPGKSEKLLAVIGRAKATRVPLAACGSWAPPEGRRGYLDPSNGQGAPHFAFTFGAHAVELEVDTETGVITILRSVLACDVGKAINPASVEGQMEGSVGMSAGWALMEETLINNGVMENTSFHNYLIPTIKDLPDLESIIVEHPNNLGPFGAKGIGEPAMLATAPAIRNALWDALGFKINSIPLTAVKVLAEIKKNAAAEKGA